MRRGEVTLDDAKQWFNDKERHLDVLYQKSNLPWGPDEPVIKQLLIDCLEHHFGDLSKAVVQVGKAETMLRQIKDIIDKGGF